MSGYVDCGCRDCFETTIGAPGEFCAECVEAGCEPDEECQAPGAYGVDPDECPTCGTVHPPMTCREQSA